MVKSDTCAGADRGASVARTGAVTADDAPPGAWAIEGAAGGTGALDRNFVAVLCKHTVVGGQACSFWRLQMFLLCLDLG